MRTAEGLRMPGHLPPEAAARRPDTPPPQQQHSTPRPNPYAPRTRILVYAVSAPARRLRVIAAGILLLGAVASPLLADTPAAQKSVTPEPSGYWTGPVNSPVPNTLTGGKVIHKARELVRLMRQGGAVVVDVSDAPRRPEGLAPGAPWLPVPHRAIPGSIWIPGAGLGEVPVSVDDFFRQRLSAATRDHLARPVVIYCHRHCWLSWNAAKRAISYGYRNVYWFRDGIEGWKAAGYPTEVIEPQFAPEGHANR